MIIVATFKNTPFVKHPTEFKYRRVRVSQRVLRPLCGDPFISNLFARFLMPWMSVFVLGRRVAFSTKEPTASPFTSFPFFTPPSFIRPATLNEDAEPLVPHSRFLRQW